MKIFVKKDKHYNKVFYYPDCTASELFCRLTGTKTLTIEALKIIRALGYDICLKQVTLPVPVEPRYYN